MQYIDTCTCTHKSTDSTTSQISKTKTTLKISQVKIQFTI